MASEIKVDTIVNAGGDNDSGIDLATNDIVKVKTADSERMRVDASGNILFNKTALNNTDTGARFNVGGDASFVKDGGACLKMNRTSNHGDVIEILKDNTSVGTIGSEGGKLNVNSNGNNNLTFAVNGSTYIAMDTARLYPNNDNNYDLGLGSSRFDDIFATNSTIQTSDQNEKQDIASATAKELNVAKKLSTLFKTFRWKDKVTEKGDKARTHTGIVAQEVQSAFKAEGLDASNYGLFTSDTWTDDDGKEQTRLGVRYPELFSFIFSSIEARLTALESK